MGVFKVRNGSRAVWWGLSIVSALVVQVVWAAEVSAQVRRPTAAGTGAAPAGFYLTPSLRITEDYDDNIFSTPQQTTTTLPSTTPGAPPIVLETPGKTSDFIFRATPGILAGYKSEPFSLLAGYEIGASVYADDSDLDSFPATQTASLTADYLPQPRLGLHVAGGYRESEDPAQLNSAAVSTVTGLAPTGIQNGRSRSELYYAGSSAEYELSLLNKVLASYAFNHNHQVGSVSQEVHTVNAGFIHRFTERDAGDLGYIFRHFSSPGTSSAVPDFTTPNGSISIVNQSSVSDSNAVTVGWSHRFSELTEVVLRGGPRFSGSNIDPEAYASISHNFARGGASFVYENTQTSAVGVTGAQNVQTFSGSLSYDLIQSLTIEPGLAYYKTKGEGSSQDSDVYVATLRVRYQFLEWLAVVLDYGFNYQKGVFSTVETSSSGVVTIFNNDQNIYRNIVSIGLEASQPVRLY